MQANRYKVTQIWAGDKGIADDQFRLPPVVLRFDGAGYSFVRSPDGIIYLTNEKFILKTNENTKSSTILQYLKAGEYWKGIGLSNERLYGIAWTPNGDVLFIMDKHGNVLHQYNIESSDNRKRHLHGTPPLWVAASQQGTLYVAGFGSDTEKYMVRPAVLQRLDSRGRLQMRWTGITGAAMDDKGRVYVSGWQNRNGELRAARFPTELDKRYWRLIGVDRRGYFYWHKNSKLKASDCFVLSSSWIARSDMNGRLDWQIELNGPTGVLAKYDPCLSVYLGWGGQWIEVDWEGIIRVFGINQDTVSRSVGLYQLDMEHSK